MNFNLIAKIDAASNHPQHYEEKTNFKQSKPAL
jgi:hypothetical protein